MRNKKERPAGNDAEPIPVHPNQTSVVVLAHADIVLDPELQCRAKGLDPQVVDDYAADMKRGVLFPAVDVVRDGDRHYLVDGWHREAASRAAGSAGITARIVPGTRRDALLAAARANTGHGLRRSHEDKRRAVRLALMDPETARLSGRKVGELVGVSHTYVDETRKKYGLTVGEPLTLELRQRIDGEATPEWVALAAGRPKFEATAVERIRTAPTLAALSKLATHSDAENAAVDLRLAELATDDRTWADTDEEAERVVAAIDNEEDAMRALRTRGCPNARKLLDILADVAHLDSDFGHHEFGKLRVKWAGRQGLIDRLDDAERARKAKTADEPHTRHNALLQLIGDPRAQRALFTSQPAEIQLSCPPRYLHRDVRDNELRTLVNEAHGGAVDCSDPLCNGWIDTASSPSWPVCVECRKRAEDIDKGITTALDRAAKLVQVPGYGLLVAPRVVVDTGSIHLLTILTTEMQGNPAWLAKVPASIRSALREWAERPVCERVGDGVADDAIVKDAVSTPEGVVRQGRVSEATRELVTELTLAEGADSVDGTP